MSRGQYKPRWVRLNHWEIYMPSHPSARKTGYIFLHIIAAEKALGKKLPKGAEVHHFNDESLVICQDRAYHRLLHTREKAFRACGDPNKRQCYKCKDYDTIDKLIVSYDNYGGHKIWHTEKCVIRVGHKYVKSEKATR